MPTVATAHRLPTRVGVAPGTTTSLLTGPTAPGGPAPMVGCENPDRVARQQYILNPPGKVNATMAAVSDAVAAAATRLVPYETIESLRGLGRTVGRGLGYLTTPAGNQSPSPSYELVAATKSRVYCTKRPERGPNYRWWETAAYEPEDRAHGMNGALGAVPTDLQLASQFTYLPVMSQWIPFQQGMWSPAPWVPPYGPPSTAPQNQGYMFPAAAAVQTASSWPPGRLNQYLGQLGAETAAATAPPPLDPASAAIEELKRQQDRTYLLGIISAAAVASTALVNVFRYSVERRAKRSGHHGHTPTRVAAEPAPMIAGARRHRRRHRSR